MAIGLRGPGPGSRARSARLYSMHVVGGALGGAATGVALGGLGDVAGLDSVPLPVVGFAAALATYLGVREKGKLGRQCQVPRLWARSARQNLVAIGWGAMLGCGVATLIPHSAFFLLAGTQLVAGPVMGAASGAIFGGVRQATILHPTMRRADPQAVMSLLPRLRRRVARLNTAVAFAGGVALVLTAWRSP